MKRSILLSLLVIGTAVGLIAGAGTFASFTDTDNDKGTVTAGNVEIEVAGFGTLDFDVPVASCPSPMAPGDECTAEVNVQNMGTLPVTLSDPVVDVTAVTGGEDTCTAADWTTGFTAYGYEGTGLELSTTTGDPNDDGADFTVTVKLNDAAQEGCQGATAEVTVTVTATNS